MSNKPKSQDYKPSEAEKTQAAVSKAEKDYFDQKYGPLQMLQPVYLELHKFNLLKI
jgi:hypothetical protein